MSGYRTSEKPREMITVHTYNVNLPVTSHEIIAAVSRVPMPDSGPVFKILSSGLSKGRIVVWAQVFTASPVRERLIRVVPSGYDLTIFYDGNRMGDYIGTAQLNDLDWHLFDLGWGEYL